MKKLLTQLIAITVALVFPISAFAITVPWNKTVAGQIYPPIYTDLVAIGTTTPFSSLSVWGKDTLSTGRAFEVVNSASTTLFSIGNSGITSLVNLLTSGSSTLQNFTAVNGTTTSATTTNLAFTGLLSSLLAVNSAGTVVATSTIGNNQLANNSITVTTASPLGGAGTIKLGDTLALTCTSCLTSVTGTYPIISSGGTTPALSLAFGTTTNNTWSGTNLLQASTTAVALTAINATTTTLCLTGDTCRTTWPTSGSAYSFTTATNYGATASASGTPFWFQAGITASTTNNYLAGFTVTPNGAVANMRVGAGNASDSIRLLTSNGLELAGTNFSMRIGSTDWFTLDATGLTTIPSLKATNATTTQATTTTSYVSTLLSGTTGYFTTKLSIGTTTTDYNSVLGIQGTTTAKGQIVSQMASSTNSTAAITVDFSAGNTQRFQLTQNTIMALNATSSNPISGGKYVLKICQDSVGSHTLTWASPVNLRWGNGGTTTIGATANTCTWVGFIYDGSVQQYTGLASSTGIAP